MSYGPLTVEQAKILGDRYLSGVKVEPLKKSIWPVSDEEKAVIPCLHDMCPHCNGTGVRKDGGGLCFHGISCPCPKCSPKC